MPEQERIVIRLTKGSLDNGYIKLGQYTSFFPKDSIGGTNEQSKAAKLLTLHFAGLPESVKTDINAKNSFRCRGDVHRFFNRHRLQPGDSIAIVRQSAYEYRVIPNPA